MKDEREKKEVASMKEKKNFSLSFKINFFPHIFFISFTNFILHPSSFILYFIHPSSFILYFIHPSSFILYFIHPSYFIL